jgi:hypothetical protein
MATTETTVELILSLKVARIPVKVRGLVEGEEFSELSGLVTIDKSLSELLRDLGADFGGPSSILRQLTGSSDIKLDSLAFAYHNYEPKFSQVIVSLTADKSRCRFVCLKRAGRDGFVAGLELRLDKECFKNNPLSGLVGEISLGDIGIYYASDTFQKVAYEPGQDFQDASQLIREIKANNPAITTRDFTRGMNWSGQIFAGGVNLLDLSKMKGRPESAQGGLVAEPSSGSGNKSTEPAKLTDSTTWIDLDKSIGPLSVQRIGFSYEDPRVVIKVDAALRLSVLNLSLVGFGLSYPLNKVAVLKDRPSEFFKHLGFQLDGAAVKFQQGPLTISGGLLKVPKPYLQLDGALLVRVPGLTVSAIASYADLNGTPSFFAFATLIKELGDPTATGFFFVIGLAFGFGVNRNLKLPTINEVHNFPLIKAATDEDYLGDKLDLRGISQKLEEYISPAVGSFWIAAGVRFTSFGQIDSFALLSVSFGTQFQIALLGLSKITLPKPPAPVLVCAELAIKVLIAPDSGLLSVEARLTENSFILRKDFKLRGGFAFYSWFAGEHAGDFVVSLGGYHPRFLPPAHYPSPDLVQFFCKVGDVTMQGSCYFAFCPSAVMAGVALSLVYQSGGIKAWFVAVAHFLVQWKPLYYDIQIAISVGVSLSLDGGTRTALSIELGASLTLYGPPLGGEARISIFVVTFTIAFGESKRVPPPLIWESNDPEKSFAKSFLMNPDVSRILLTDGLLEEAKHVSRTRQFVNPHRLKIACSTQVPSTAVLINGKDPVNMSGVKLNGQVPGAQPWWNQKIGVRPMAKSECYSLLNVTFGPRASGPPDRIKTMQEYLEQFVEISLTTGKAPRALWAADKLDPSIPSQNQMVENALVGLEIKTKEGPRPWETPCLDLKVLAYDRKTKTCDFAMVGPRKSLPDYGDKTISTTIAAPEVQTMRKDILDVLRKSGRGIMKPEEIQVKLLQENASYIFQATPVMAGPGQYPPRSFTDI